MPDSRGRPSKWQHQPTKQLRLPAAFEAQILEYTRLLDSGESDDNFGAKFTETQIREAIAAVLQRVPPNKRAAQSRMFNQFLSHLKGES